MGTKPKADQRVVLALVLILLAALTPAVQAAGPGKPDGEHAPDSVLVRFHQNASPAEKASAHALVGADKVHAYTLVPGLENIRMKAGGVGAEQAVERLSRLPFVAYAEPDYLVHATGTPIDPYYGNLWGMANIHAPVAWDVFTGDPNFVVAVIDTGIDYNHPDLAANIWTNPGEIPGNGVDDDHNGYVDDMHGWDFAYGDNNPSDVYRHGSHVSGILGAVGNNGVGVAGMNWRVKLMALKFLGDTGTGYISDAIEALNYAVNEGARVSNNSWGGGLYVQAMYDAIRSAAAAGDIFVAAAGNSSTDSDGTPFYPASYPLDNIIAVASINSNDDLSSFSNYGATSVDLAAPGENILSTTPGNTYSYNSGTSMATPHVAGVAALLYGVNPAWGYQEVKSRILSTARQLASLAGQTVTGGTLDAGAAVGTAPVQPPLAPTNLSATAFSSSQIDLAWSDTSGETGYKIERCTGSGCTDFAPIATVGANATRYSDTGLSGGTTYSYRIRTYNTAGDSPYSNIAGATTPAAPTVPPAPSGLIAKALSSTQINLKWTDNSDIETGFRIERCTGPGCTNFAEIATSGANTTSYPSTGLSSLTAYSYRVRAYNASGNSAYSNTASAKTKR